MPKKSEEPLLNIMMGLKPFNISAYLSKKYGGKWKYDQRGTWWCNDNKRHVSRVSMCTCDDDCEHTPGYFLYGPGSSIPVYWD